VTASSSSDLVYLVENPEGYVAYSKATTVTVSLFPVEEPENSIEFTVLRNVNMQV
jgi:hypothetical protein